MSRAYPIGDIKSMNDIKFQLVSDLYLSPVATQLSIEKMLAIKIIPKANILLVAGGIADVWSDAYVVFLEWVYTRFERIILVMGNYEYNNQHTMADSENCLRQLVREYDNVTFLQKEMYYFTSNHRTYIILGCTLWTDPYISPPVQLKNVESIFSNPPHSNVILNHFKEPTQTNNQFHIYISNEPISKSNEPNQTTTNQSEEQNTTNQANPTKRIDMFEIHELHRDHRKWLLNTAADIKYSNTGNAHYSLFKQEYCDHLSYSQFGSLGPTNEPPKTYPPYFSYGTIIALTHYCPSRLLSQVTSFLNSYKQNPEFYTDIEPWVSSHVRMWVCGHNQRTNEYNSRNGTKYLSNCSNAIHFSPSFYVTI